MFLFVLAGLFRIVFAQLLQNSSSPTDDQFLTNYFDIHNQLIDKLFKTYKKELPAVYLGGRYNRVSRPVHVNISLMYYRLLAIDQAKQSSQIIADLYYEWTDPRLVWNPSDYYGIDEIAVVNKDTVWIPDVLPFDTFSFSDTLPQEQQSVNIAYDGSMTTYTSTVIDFICHMNLKKYPFDEQTCELQLSSFNYPRDEMVVVGLIGFDMSDLTNAGNGEWNMINITVDNSIFSYGQSGVYSNPIFYFTMKRSTNYYILLLITPSFILTVLCVFGLFWTPVRADDYMESLNLGFAAILALMFVLQTGTQDMPKIDVTDKLSIYLLSNLVLLTVAIGMVMVLGKFAKNYCHKGRKDSKLFAFMRDYVYEYLHLFLMLTFTLTAIVNLLIQNNLTDSIFARYNRIVPAIYLAGRNNFKAEPLKVNITLLYCRLLTVDEPKQSVLLIADLLTEWTDPRLKWNPAEYYGIKNIVITAKETVWLPDVLGFDSVATTETLPEDQQSVNLAFNGSANIYKTVIIEFLCRLELTDFPFDTQFCELQMSSFNYPENEMKVLGFLGSTIANDLDDTGNGEWNMEYINVTNWEFNYGPFAKVYSNPVFTFVMKRSTNYYILLLITPSFILTLLCMLGLFWKPVDADSYMENLNLGFAAILAMMFVLQTGTEGMPKINETDKLSRYLIENLCLITVACIIVMLLGKTRRKQAKRNTSDTRIRQLFRLSLAHVHSILMVGFSFLAILNFILLVT